MRAILQATWLDCSRRLKRSAEAWNEFWFSPADTATLAVIRICTGLILLYVYGSVTLNVLTYIGPEAWIDDQSFAEVASAVDSNFEEQQRDPEPQYKLSVWSFLRHPTLVIIFHYYFLAAIVCLTAGLFTRVSNAVVWIGHLSFLHRSTLTYGIDAILAMLLLYLLLAPTGRDYSLDRILSRYWRKRSKLPAPAEAATSWAANLSLRAIQVHMCVIYACSGLSKLQGESWWNGSAIWQVMMIDNLSPLDLRWLGYLDDRWISVICAVGVLITLLVEIGFPFLIWNRSMRPVMLAGVLILHCGIGLVMGLGAFSAAMLTGCLAFVSPAGMRWFLRSCLRRESTDDATPTVQPV